VRKTLKNKTTQIFTFKNCSQNSIQQIEKTIKKLESLGAEKITYRLDDGICTMILTSDNEHYYKIRNYISEKLDIVEILL